MNDEDGIGDSEIDLLLEREGTFVHFYEIVDTDDAATCLAEVVPLFEETIGLSDSGPLLDDDGDPIRHADDLNSRAVREVTSDDFAGYEYASCWEIEEGATAVFAGAIVSDDVAGEDLPLLDGLYAEVRTYLDGEQNGQDSGTEAATPDAATPAASDEGGVYLSPTYGYLLEWDETYWSPIGMSSDDEGTDALTVIADDLHADLVGYVNGDGDVETCLDDFLAIQQGEAPDAVILETDDGESLEISADGTMLTAMIVSTDGEVSTGTLFTCTSISDEAVVRLSVTGESDRLMAEHDAIQQLFDGLLVIPATE